jgi:hypothetical protein
VRRRPHLLPGRRRPAAQLPSWAALQPGPGYPSGSRLSRGPESHTNVDMDSKDQKDCERGYEHPNNHLRPAPRRLLAVRPGRGRFDFRKFDVGWLEYFVFIVVCLSLFASLMTSASLPQPADKFRTELRTWGG